jgi:hypothetical protein
LPDGQESVLERAVAVAGIRRQAHVEVMFLRIDDVDGAEQVLGQGFRRDGPSFVGLMPDSLGESLFEGMQRGEIRMEPPPGLVLYDGQWARVANTARHGILYDYLVEASGMGDAEVGPLVGPVVDGASVEVVARHVHDRWWLDVEAVWAEVQRPIQVVGTQLAGSWLTARVEVPQISRVRLTRSVELPGRGCYVIAGTEVESGSLRVVVLRVETR